MPRRHVTIGRKTHAKGETFELEKKDRYFLNVSLMSLKTRRDYDVGRGGEFFFRVDKKGEIRGRRTPDHGQIELQENQVFEARQDFTLWTEFIKLEQGDPKEVILRIRLYEHDYIKNEKIIDERIAVKLGMAQSKYITVEDKKGNTKAKLKISSARTRF
ncbi:MAG: hypothetical protein ACTSPY_09215 [Candidatus Helarchaeota archaeon]